MNKVTFGPYNCNVKICTNSSIVCETTSAYTVHDVTNNGNDVKLGTGYAWDKSYLTIKIGEIVRWTWAQPTGVTGKNYKIEQVESPLSTAPLQSGFSSGESTSAGSFSYQFNVAGTYFYWSGFVDSTQTISFRGVIVVEGETDKELEIDVTLSDIKGLYLYLHLFIYTYVFILVYIFI